MPDGLQHRRLHLQSRATGSHTRSSADPITAEALYPRWRGLLAFRRHRHRRNRHGVHGFGVRAAATRRTVPQPDPVGRHRMGYPGSSGGDRRRAEPTARLVHRRRIPPADGAGNRSVPPPWSEANQIRAEQLRIPHRANALQRSKHRLQRSRTLESNGTSARSTAPTSSSIEPTTPPRPGTMSNRLPG